MSQQPLEKNSAYTFAIWSMITALLAPVVGIVLGHVSLYKYKQQKIQEGWRLAVFATCLAWSIFIMQTFFFIGFISTLFIYYT